MKHIIRSCLLWITLLVPALTAHSQDDPVQTTLWNLDMSGIAFRLDLPDELSLERRALLKARAIAQLTAAGLYKGEPKILMGTLIITLRAYPTDAMGVPDKVIWSPRIELWEPAQIVRNGTQLARPSWSISEYPHVRNPVTFEECQQMVDEYIAHFIANYRLGNGTGATQNSKRE